MGMQKAFLTCICLCGTFLLTESWRPSQDKNALFKTLSRSHGIKAAAVHLDENNGEQSLYDSQNEFPAGKLMFCVYLHHISDKNGNSFMTPYFTILAKFFFLLFIYLFF